MLKSPKITAGQDGSRLQIDSVSMSCLNSKHLAFQSQMKSSTIAIQEIKSTSQMQLLCRVWISLNKKGYLTDWMTVDTSSYVGQVCALKNCSAFVSAKKKK